MYFKESTQELQSCNPHVSKERLILSRGYIQQPL